MDPSTPPSLPDLNDDSSLKPGTGSRDMAGLARFSLGEADAAIEPQAEGRALLESQDWMDLAQAVSDAEGGLRSTVARLAFAGGDSGMGPEDQEAYAQVLRAAHGADVLIFADGPWLVLALPEGVHWATIASTVEAAAGGVQITVGLAEFGVGDQTLEDALRLSVAAVEIAEKSGCRVVVHSLADEVADLRDRAIADGLVKSLETGKGLRLVFQPKFDVATRAIVGAEALLRHECENHGAIGPAEFLPIAERAGIRASVERWVLDAGVEAIGDWLAQGQLAFPVSLNVAPTDVFAPAFVSEMEARLGRYGVDPKFLRLEVAEAGVVEDLDVAVQRLEAIRALGISVALDDFGVTETEITDLRRLPVDVLKVHRSFVLEMGRSASVAALVRGVLSLARVLGIETVAAGVESEEQMSQLEEFGCDIVQGFLLSAPLERGAFEALLKRA